MSLTNVPKKKENYFFSWDDTPGKDNVQLLKFLKDDIKIEWAENAKIKKSDDGKVITVAKDEKSLELELNEKENKVTLKISGVNTCEYILKEENGKINIYKENSYGWIPTLTSALMFGGASSVMKAEKQYGYSLVDMQERDHILNVLLDDFSNSIKLKDSKIFIYKRIHIESDIKPSKEYWHILFIDEYWKIVYVLMLSKKELKGITNTVKTNILVFAEIDYKKNVKDDAYGLIEINVLSFNKDKIYDMLCNEVYVCVRGVYHLHTHHTESDELLLHVVNASSGEEAKLRIIDQFQQKIIEYHRILRKGICEHEDEKTTLDKIFLSQGEMLYAKRFIELADDKKEWTHIKRAFNTAFESFCNFGMHIDRYYEHERSKRMEALTFWVQIATVFILALTALISADAGHDLVGASKFDMFIFLIIFIFTLFVLLYILRILKQKHIFKKMLKKYSLR